MGDTLLKYAMEISQVDYKYLMWWDKAQVIVSLIRKIKLAGIPYL